MVLSRTRAHTEYVRRHALEEEEEESKKGV
jgi:hypothetical protein